MFVGEEVFSNTSYDFASVNAVRYAGYLGSGCQFEASRHCGVQADP